MCYFVELCRKFIRLEALIYKAFCDIIRMYKIIREEKIILKKVVIVYDNLLHKPKLHNLTSFDNAGVYEYEDIFIDNVKDISNIFKKSDPDIYIMNVNFNDFEVINEIKSISERNTKDCKIVAISKSSNLRDMLFNTKIPERIFPLNIASDVLYYTIKELTNTHSLPNRFLFINLIEQLELKPYSPTTQYFIATLQVCMANPYLLGGHVNNVFYSVSKKCNISTETARKSVYKVIDNARYSDNKEYIHSIFGNTKLNDISPSRFLEQIVWKFRTDKR